MMRLGLTQDEVIAKEVCAKITRVMGVEQFGNEIAIRSAKEIVEKIRTQIGNEHLVQAIETELKNCHTNVQWQFA